MGVCCSKKSEALECSKSTMDECIISAEHEGDIFKMLILLPEGKEEDKLESCGKLSEDETKRISNEIERLKAKLQKVSENVCQMVPVLKTSKLKSDEPRENENIEVGTRSNEGRLNSPSKYGSSNRENNPSDVLADITEKSPLLGQTGLEKNTKMVSDNYIKLKEKLDECRAENEYLLSCKRVLKNLLETTNQKLEKMRQQFSSDSLPNLFASTATYGNDKKQLLGDGHFDEGNFYEKNDAEYQKMIRYMSNFTSWLELLLQEFQEKEFDIHEKNRLIEEKKKEIEKLYKLLGEAKKDSDQLKQELENHLQEKRNLEKQALELKEKHTSTKDRLKKEIQNLVETNCQTEETLKQELTQLEIENKTLREEIDKLKAKPSCQVQVFSPSSLPMMKQMQTELVSLIQKRLDESVLLNDIDVAICESAEKLKQDLPILLLCMNVSRLGTDAANALHGLKPNLKMALVVIHHKDTHALPNQASDRVLVDSSFKELGGIFDIAFLSEKGVYSCKMNEENVSKIIAFLLKLEQEK